MLPGDVVLRLWQGYGGTLTKNELQRERYAAVLSHSPMTAVAFSEGIGTAGLIMRVRVGGRTEQDLCADTGAEDAALPDTQSWKSSTELEKAKETVKAINDEKAFTKIS